MGLLGATASTAAREAGHIVSFAVTGSMMTLMNVYVGYTSQRRSNPFTNKYGPFILTFLSSILIMLEPSRHLFMDHSLLGSEFSEYQDNCNSEWWVCLAPAGWIITICATYIGFILLMIGSLWNANIVSKFKLIRTKWNQIWSQRAQEKLLDEDSAPTIKVVS